MQDQENYGGSNRPEIPAPVNENKDQKSVQQVTYDENKDNSPGRAEMDAIDNGMAMFSEEEIQNLREIFDLFDKEKNGTIDVKDLHTIMGSLQRDPAEVEDLIDQIGEGENARIDFEAFVNLMQQVEAKIAK